MFKKPEEIIIAVLGIAWIILAYFITARLKIPTELALEIISYNSAWTLVLYLFWKNDKLYYSWPIFLGLLFAVWTPLLTAYAQNQAGITPAAGGLICIAAPWFATWYVKFGAASAIVILGYIWLLIADRKK